MSKVVVVWKTENEIDIHNFVIPYVYNSKKQGWFDEVEVLIWGASQEKVMNTPLIQDRIIETDKAFNNEVMQKTDFAPVEKSYVSYNNNVIRGIKNTISDIPKSESDLIEYKSSQIIQA